MTDTKMSFKDALIAHLNGEANGENVQAKGSDGEFRPFLEIVGNHTLDFVLGGRTNDCYEFRIKPRTVMCNGVEVPAPESVAPQYGWVVHYPNHMSITGHDCTRWGDESWLVLLLERGLVYLNKEDAIARAKAMLITK